MLRLRRAVLPACALLIIAFGSLLRLDAFVQKYGPLEHPAWARVLTHRIAPLAAYVRPEAFRWRPETRPYLGGDPINYLRYAREMTTFYQPHVREPIFLALTRASLWLVGDQDEGLSLASATGSVLAILGTCLLGAALGSPFVGLAAALVVAAEFEIVTWAPDGWRDDAFTAAVVFAAWALLRFSRAPAFGSALAVGAASGIACLTRITALSFVLPGLAWLLVDASAAERRARWRPALLAAFILAVIVAPYLLSCAIATGDPLYAINYHTGYYRFGEGLPSAQPMSASAYVRAKLAQHPIAGVDTAITGVFVQPFVTKWNGLDPWISGLTGFLYWFALAGLAMLLFSRPGRLFLVMLFTSILPYALTWNVAGGGEWRFTMHAYPFFLVAAFYAVERTWRTAVDAWRSRARPADLVPWVGLRHVAITAAVLANLVAGYLWLPWFVVREAVGRAEDVSVEAGGRDFAFFGAGWSPPHKENIVARVSGERAVVRLPLPERRGYEVVLRLDPVAPEKQERFTVLLNRHLLAHVRFAWNPQRVGSYHLLLPERDVVAGANELTIVPESIVTASSAGPRFAWLDPALRIGVRLWHVRVLGR